MNRRPIYFYFRSSWKRRRWHPIRFKRMLTPYETMLLEYIEKVLKPKGTGFGDWAKNSIAQLLYHAAVTINISNNQGVSPHTVNTLKFLQRRARRPGHAFYATPGLKLRKGDQILAGQRMSLS
jgi:hypothetical protein